MTSMMIAEDWISLSRAVEYYNGLGYQYIDVPWMVEHETSAITCPAGYEIMTDHGALVGSAEQGFLQLIKDEKLDYGTYMSVSPCFRNEVADATHQPYFMKLELFQYADAKLKTDLIPRMWRMVDDAKNFMGGNHVQYDDLSVDLELNGVEVGSYGVRMYDTYKWVFGTGLALPRWRIAKNES